VDRISTLISFGGVDSDKVYVLRTVISCCVVNSFSVAVRFCVIFSLGEILVSVFCFVVKPCAVDCFVCH
jgi:hypothetical protein